MQTQRVSGRTQAQMLAAKGSWGQKGNNCNFKVSPVEQTLCASLVSESEVMNHGAQSHGLRPRGLENAHCRAQEHSKQSLLRGPE